TVRSLPAVAIVLPSGLKTIIQGGPYLCPLSCTVFRACLATGPGAAGANRPAKASTQAPVMVDVLMPLSSRGDATSQQGRPAARRAGPSVLSLLRRCLRRRRRGRRRRCSRWSRGGSCRARRSSNSGSAGEVGLAAQALLFP